MRITSFYFLICLFCSANCIAQQADSRFLHNTLKSNDLKKYFSSYEQAIAEKLLDPTSAKFRDEHAQHFDCGRCDGSYSDNIFFCGQLLAKNMHGAYVGWKRFWAVLRSVDEKQSYALDWKFEDQPFPANLDINAYDHCVNDQN